MFDALKNLFFPPKCMVCGSLMSEENVFSICPGCFKELSFNSGKRCRVCSTPIELMYGDDLCSGCRRAKRYFEKTSSPFVYEDKVREIITRYKFRSRKSYAAPLAAFMFTDLKNLNMTREFDLVTFVPLHRKRLGERGYNQSELLAENLAKIMDKPLVCSLKKIKDIAPLSKTEHGKRSELVKGCFEALGDVSGKKILLIDDIITTGATVNECSKMLKRAGAKKVFVAVVAATRS